MVGQGDEGHESGQLPSALALLKLLMHFAKHGMVRKPGCPESDVTCASRKGVSTVLQVGCCIELAS